LKIKALLVLGCVASVQVGAAGMLEPVTVRIPAGRFQMGSVKGEPGREGDEAQRHAVRIPRAFGLSKYEVTEKEWGACFADGACVAARDPRRDAFPVTDVRWSKAQAYVSWLSPRTGKRYRLPTEAEWEYAARAGSSGPACHRRDAEAAAGPV
jgi:formylglycine-generating enzyme required for sulfatase activity